MAGCNKTDTQSTSVTKTMSQVVSDVNKVDQVLSNVNKVDEEAVKKVECNVRWAGSHAVAADGLLVHAHDDVDLATRCFWLQHSLRPLVKSSWYGEVRAWLVSPNDQRCLNLTLRPGDWRSYYEATYTKTEFKQERAIKDAWAVLAYQTKQQDGQQPTVVNTLIVTKYSNPVENACGFFTGCAVYNACITDLSKMMTESTARHPRVVAAAFDCKRSWTNDTDVFFEILRLRDLRKKLCLSCELEHEHEIQCRKLNNTVAAKTKDAVFFVLKNTETTAASANDLVHLHGDVFSDVFHQKLTPNCVYTRDDVLERVKVCGEVLLLHDKAHWHDEEVVFAALEALHGTQFYQNFQQHYQNNEQFWVRASRAHSHVALKVPAQFRNNLDIRVSLLQYASWEKKSRFHSAINAWVKDAKRDKHVWLAAAARATKYSTVNWTYMPPKLSNDENFVIELVSMNHLALYLLSNRLTSPGLKEITVALLLKCLKANWRAYFHPLAARLIQYGTLRYEVCAQLGQAKCAAQYFVHLSYH